MGLPGLLVLPIFVGGLAQLIGMPVAWLRLRRTRAWIDRPAGVRTLDLLAAYLKPVTTIAIAASAIFATLFLLVCYAGGEASGSAWVIAGLAALYGLPLLFVPFAAASLEPSRLGRLKAYREAAARGAASPASHSGGRIGGVRPG
jgi:hypothetical protein